MSSSQEAARLPAVSADPSGLNPAEAPPRTANPSPAKARPAIALVTSDPDDPARGSSSGVAANPNLEPTAALATFAPPTGAEGPRLIPTRTPRARRDQRRLPWRTLVPTVIGIAGILGVYASSQSALSFEQAAARDLLVAAHGEADRLRTELASVRATVDGAVLAASEAETQAAAAVSAQTAAAEAEHLAEGRADQAIASVAAIAGDFQDKTNQLMDVVATFRAIASRPTTDAATRVRLIGATEQLTDIAEKFPTMLQAPTLQLPL